jgi:hypothetical protein
MAIDPHGSAQCWRDRHGQGAFNKAILAALQLEADQ